jgi:hypothetical protein
LVELGRQLLLCNNFDPIPEIVALSDAGRSMNGQKKPGLMAGLFPFRCLIESELVAQATADGVD